jgi:hypothetical protein
MFFRWGRAESMRLTLFSANLASRRRFAARFGIGATPAAPVQLTIEID